MNRGIHTQPNVGQTQSWITPKPVIDALGPFDLDPCACSMMPWRTAERMIAPPDDGLAEDWNGRVWLNPPYGENELWLEKLASHGNGIALVAARTEVKKWFVPFIWERATAVQFLFGRLYYHRPDGSRGAGNAGHGSCLVAYGDENLAALRKSGIEGRIVEC